MKANHILCAGLLALAAAGAQAQHTVYLGGAHIDVDATMPPLTGGPAIPAPGALLRIGSADTLGFGYTYRYSPEWSAEVALGLPPAHKVYGAGFIQAFGQVSVVEQMPPTVFANYHFVNLWQRVQPFVGLGINYTRFTKTRSTPSGDAASGGPTSIKLSDSWGLAGHVGLTVQYDKHWSLVATVARADVKSDMTAVTQTRDGEITRSTRINFRPTVYSLSLGYSF